MLVRFGYFGGDVLARGLEAISNSGVLAVAHLWSAVTSARRRVHFHLLTIHFGEVDSKSTPTTQVLS